METELMAKLRSARANGDPDKYTAFITVSEAHRIANEFEEAEANINLKAGFIEKTIDQLAETKQTIHELVAALEDARPHVPHHTVTKIDAALATARKGG